MARNGDDYRYLSDATNRMMSVSAYPERHTSAEMAEAAAVACEALKRLLADDRFHSALNDWRKRADETIQERRELQRDIALLADLFLSAEEGILRESGHDQDAAKRILWMAAACKDDIAGQIDAKRIVGNIETLRNACCKAATEIYEIHDVQQRRGFFRRLGLGMGGASLVVFDSFAIATSAGTSVASITIGGILLGKAVD